MSLVFSAISPHPPIIIPSIGKEHLENITKTKEALASLERDLYAAKPDILIIISPHGHTNADHFTINLSDNFEINFEDFGDFSTKIPVKGDILLMTNDKERISSKSPINIISETKLDHGIGIPFYCLGQNIQNIKIIPIYFSLLDNQSHLDFGKILKEVIFSTDKRIAVIASADLSHCLTENAPAKFNPAGKEFDEGLIKLLQAGDSQGIVNMDTKTIGNAAECGLRSILILLGILNNINYETKILSYEAPFGVGYLTANLELK
ncbi:AmmeMemoRadiSam system protein B [Candidatus Falkowbacteria bacterium]|uniref:AmmeMemoRadiSam system protein B n=1 Tax=Candidatus Buchananbacteria bacterium CG10_big_fil_rev_8_21_14_0_10_33_19 TaxID=1974525 RepID=A0A2H0W3M4_9BACT|nr:AmmeMemoRadiSam system protein B [Candidatus Falkowbacteria bacterium]PIS05959.1 MAG: AmmeMemoRadiSam system protein B [Candidatus Buchananbacteria bacterium CG10_big_fil_rev_8_21_14_0_10_33_19]